VGQLTNCGVDDGKLEKRAMTFDVVNPAHQLGGLIECTEFAFEYLRRLKGDVKLRITVSDARLAEAFCGVPISVIRSKGISEVQTGSVKLDAIPGADLYKGDIIRLIQLLGVFGSVSFEVLGGSVFFFNGISLNVFGDDLPLAVIGNPVIPDVLKVENMPVFTSCSFDVEGLFALHERSDRKRFRVFLIPTPVEFEENSHIFHSERILFEESKWDAFLRDSIRLIERIRSSGVTVKVARNSGESYMKLVEMALAEDFEPAIVCFKGWWSVRIAFYQRPSRELAGILSSVTEFLKVTYGK
jgi:hypothetical protein